MEDAPATIDACTEAGLVVTATRRVPLSSRAPATLVAAFRPRCGMGNPRTVCHTGSMSVDTGSNGCGMGNPRTPSPPPSARLWWEPELISIGTTTRDRGSSSTADSDAKPRSRQWEILRLEAVPTLELARPPRP